MITLLVILVVMVGFVGWVALWILYRVHVAISLMETVAKRLYSIDKDLRG